MVNKRGLDLKPLPSDFLVESIGDVTPADWCMALRPYHHSLDASSKAIKEYLGRAVGR
jgi:hypothetical protein